MDVTQNVSSMGEIVSQTLNFQKIVLIIAIVILIVSLVFIGMQIKKSKSKQAWPPIVSQCPDYWVIETANGPNKGKCKTTEQTPASACNTTSGIDFTIGDYAGAGSACKKKEWANKCVAPVAWEGITYGAPDPCAIKSNK